MATLVVILPTAPRDPVLWGLVAEGALVSSGWHPPDAALGVQADHVVAVVPGTAVLLREVQFPSGNEVALRKAAPFLLEDDLAVDPAEMHFALGRATEGGRAVAMVAHTTMESWQARLAALGVKAAVMLPDYLALRSETGHLVDVGSHVLAPGEFAAETELLPWLLDTTPAAIETRSDAQRLEEAAASDAGLNLLQGLYAPRRDWRGALLVWRRAGALAAAAAVAGLALLVGDGLRLSNGADAAGARAEAVVRQALPDVKRVVNPRAQMRAAVQELEAKGGNAFLRTSSVLFAAVGEVEGAEIQLLRFDAKQGDVAATLSLPDFEAIERIKTAVKQRGGALQEGAARQESGRALAEVTVRQP